MAIDNGKGAVGPSEKTVQDGTYQPLSRPIYIYVSKKSLEKPEVKEFVEFYLKNAPKLVKASQIRAAARKSFMRSAPTM